MSAKYTPTPGRGASRCRYRADDKNPWREEVREAAGNTMNSHTQRKSFNQISNVPVRAFFELAAASGHDPGGGGGGSRAAGQDSIIMRKVRGFCIFPTTSSLCRRNIVLGTSPVEPGPLPPREGHTHTHLDYTQKFLPAAGAMREPPLSRENSQSVPSANTHTSAFVFTKHREIVTLFPRHEAMENTYTQRFFSLQSQGQYQTGRKGDWGDIVPIFRLAPIPVVQHTHTHTFGTNIKGKQ